MFDLLPVIRFLQRINEVRFSGGSRLNDETIRKIASEFDNKYFFALGSDGIGDAIEKEFEEADEIAYIEKKLAREYLSEDYQYVYSEVEKRLGKAKTRGLQDDCSFEQEEDLRAAGYLLLRGRKDIKRILRYCSGPTIITNYRSYPQILEALDDMSNEIHLRWEFPRSYNNIKDLNRELRIAVRLEDYGKAAELRDNIEQVVAGNNPMESEWKIRIPSSFGGLMCPMKKGKRKISFSKLRDKKDDEREKGDIGNK
jgi:hypothetical protein